MVKGIESVAANCRAVDKIVQKVTLVEGAEKRLRKTLNEARQRKVRIVRTSTFIRLGYCGEYVMLFKSVFRDKFELHNISEIDFITTLLSRKRTGQLN